MSKLHGRIGELRIYDSSDIVARGNASNMDVEVFDADDGAGSYTEKTTEAFVADASYTGGIFVEEDDFVFVGCKTKFARIKVVKGAGGSYQTGGGAIALEYFDGDSWKAVEGQLDETALLSQTLKQDGVISFKIPVDWALRGETDLDTDKYYIRLSTAEVPTVPPSLDLLAPVDGLYYYVPFVKMDYNGPLGRGRREEILVLNRGTLDSYANHMEGGDEKLFGSVQIGFSADIDDTHNRIALNKALICDNPASTYWNATGESSKGTSYAEGTTKYPVFVDTTKKTVNIQVLWDNGVGIPMGFAFYEIFFDGSELKLTESDEGLAMALSGLCFGAIEIINEFGVRY
jgi:hypothetical protein